MRLQAVDRMRLQAVDRIRLQAVDRIRLQVQLRDVSLAAMMPNGVGYVKLDAFSEVMLLLVVAVLGFVFLRIRIRIGVRTSVGTSISVSTTISSSISLSMRCSTTCASSKNLRCSNLH